MVKELSDGGKQSKEDRLFALINKHAAFPAYPLTETTCIQTDLGLDGDEAYNMLHEIQTELGVDLSAIDSRYFTSEFRIGIDLMLTLFTPVIWLGMYMSGKGKKMDLLVGDLMKAVESGHWEHPNRSSKFPWQRLPKRK